MKFERAGGLINPQRRLGPAEAGATDKEHLRSDILQLPPMYFK
jgi:hypothetical protein